MDSVCADHCFTYISYGSDHDGSGSDHGTSGSDHAYVTFSHADDPSSAPPLQREADRQH